MSCNNQREEIEMNIAMLRNKRYQMLNSLEIISANLLLSSPHYRQYSKQLYDKIRSDLEINGFELYELEKKIKEIKE